MLLIRSEPCRHSTYPTPRNPKAISSTTTTALFLFLSAWRWLLWLPAQFFRQCPSVRASTSKIGSLVHNCAEPIQLGPLYRGPLFTPSPEGAEMKFVLFIAAAVILVRDPSGKWADDPLQPWFESLRNKAGLYCCLKADAHPLDDGQWDCFPPRRVDCCACRYSNFRS